MKNKILLLWSALFVLSFSAHADDRKNVLWIYLEDVSGWFSCYGDTVIETPNIDSLAGSGIRFTRFYTPAGVCSATRSAIVTGMMQTSIGAHNHRSCRADFRGKSMGEYDKNVLPESATPLPIRFRKAGYWTFNEGGKDDYNFEWNVEEFYDFERSKGGWGPATFVAGDCLKGRKEGQPFFGQIQLGGGKLGKRAPQKVDRSAVPIPPYYPDVEEVREEIAHHYDCLLHTDMQVGQVIQALKDQGEYENTLIFLFSDHGMKLHRHKQMLYDGGIHMPCIVAGPGIEEGKVRDDLVSGIDVSAASLAAAGIAIPETMEGRDFLAKDYDAREYVVAARDRCDYTIEKIRAIVTPRFKYLRNYLTDRPYMQPTYKDPWPVTKKFREMIANGEMNETQLLLFGKDRVPEEFYDIANDPHEINNLADDPDFADDLEKHRAYLAEWIEATGDKGQAPESDIGLKCALKRWGDKCINPEYDRVRGDVAAAKDPKKENDLWEVVKIGDADYISLENVQRFYQFESRKDSEDAVELRHTRVVLKIQKSSPQKITIGNVEFTPHGQIVARGEDLFLTTHDIAGVIDPIIRPSYVKDRRSFTSVDLTLDFPAEWESQRSEIFAKISKELNKEGLAVGKSKSLDPEERLSVRLTVEMSQNKEKTISAGWAVEAGIKRHTQNIGIATGLVAYLARKMNLQQQAPLPAAYSAEANSESDAHVIMQLPKPKIDHLAISDAIIFAFERQNKMAETEAARIATTK